MARLRVKAAPPPGNLGRERSRGHWRMGAIDKVHEFEPIDSISRNLVVGLGLAPFFSIAPPQQTRRAIVFYFWIASLRQRKRVDRRVRQEKEGWKTG